VHGATLVAHGLHYAGPDDPRMDRFLSILAHAGYLVVCPVLPTYTSLLVDARVEGELARALALLESLDERPRDARPMLFSISFGSLPALRLAARDDARARLSHVVTFGGYVDFRRTLAFALGAREDAPLAPTNDPLNLPVVVMNLLAASREVPCDPTRVVALWHRAVRATWGRPEMKDPARHHAIARDLARSLDDEEERRFFLMGCGVEPGARAFCERALMHVDARPFDPRVAIMGARVPIHAIHGVDDDVIPYSELARLRALAPLVDVPVATHLTGLFSHTGHAERPRATMVDAVREARTMLDMLRALSP